MNKVIIFDLMGVIFPNINRGPKYNVRRLYKMLKNPNLSFADFYERYSKLVEGKISQKDFWEGVSIEDTEKVELKDTYEPYPRLEELMAKFKVRFAIVALSNHPKEWVECLDKKHSFLQHFDYMFISGETGVKKPDHKAYRHVWEKYKVKPEDIILVDDQLKNLIPAKELGLKTVYLNAHGANSNFEPEAEIKSLDEIFKVKNLNGNLLRNK